MYVVFEGPDGSGKSTMLKMVEEELKSRMWFPPVFHQPGSTVLGEELRRLCKDKDMKACGESQLYMTVADHYQFVTEHITDASTYLHDKNSVFLQDRHSAISGYAYQVVGNGVDYIKYYDAHSQLLNQFPESEPDIVLLCQPTLGTILKRIAKRGQKTDRYEGEAFLKKVLRGYKEVPEKGIFDKKRYVRIPSDCGVKEQYKHIQKALQKALHFTV
jgi:dTMP kinase